MITLDMTTQEAAEVRAALLDTRLPWSPTLDRVTKQLLDQLTRRQHG